MELTRQEMPRRMVMFFQSLQKNGKPQRRGFAVRPRFALIGNAHKKLPAKKKATIRFYG